MSILLQTMYAKHCMRFLLKKHRTQDSLIKMRGTTSDIVGRGLIIHADEDDCGKGGHEDSLITGHAGKRIACADNLSLF